MEGRTAAISFMTVAELYEGALRAKWGSEKMDRLKGVLRSYVVVPASPGVCREWAEIRAERFRQPISVADGWVAACARFRSVPLITHDADDFAGITRLVLITELGD